MHIEKYLDKMLQKNIFVVIKKHSKAASAFNFVVASVAGLCAVMHFFQEPFVWFAFLGMTLICLIYAANFLFGVDHLQMVVPNAGKPLKLYKIDDVYFVGYSRHEAQLFATLQNKHNSFIEEFENSVYTFE